MLISAASQRSDPSRLCRLIAISAPAILKSSSDDVARSVYVATILQLLDMFRHSALEPSHHPGGVLTHRPLYQPGLKAKRAGSTGDELEVAFTIALRDVFGNAKKDTSIDKLTAYFQAISEDVEPEPKAAKATPEQAKRFLSKLADAIPA